MKKLNSNGWGMDTMISFLIAFVIFLIIVVFLTYKAGAMQKKNKIIVDFIIM